MTSHLAVSYITRLPEVSTSKLRELMFAIDWWDKQACENGLMAEQAWQKWDAAIERNEPHDEIAQRLAIAEMFENNVRFAKRARDNAKRDYLALHN